MTEFVQNEVDPGEDPRLEALTELAGGDPFIFLQAHDFEGDGTFGLKMDIGGGVSDLDTIWHFLHKALTAIEGEMLNRGEIPNLTLEDDEEELDDADNGE